MGLLDAFSVIDLLDGPGLTQRRGNRIFDRGERLPATLTGIEVRTSGEGSTDYVWGVEVRRPGGEPFRAACHQGRPTEAWDVVRLGMPLEVAHRKGEVVLRFEPQMSSWRPARRCDDGIDDARVRRPSGPRHDAEVGGWRPKTLLGMDREEVDLLLGGAWRKAWVPEYCGHLLAAGTVLPVDERGQVDWLAALERHGHGVGVPRPPATHDPEAGPSPEERAAAFAGRLMGASGGDPGEVTFEQWVEVSAGIVRDRVPPADHDAYAQAHGVAPGAWAPGEAAWKGRMLSDWQLGARFGEAFQQAVRRR
jgi:hypothetical protein